MNNTQINKQLSGSYILIEIINRAWTGKRTDKRASHELEEGNNALSGSARVVKDLMAGSRAELKAVTASQAAIRSYMYTQTLPWTASSAGRNTGPRLLAAVNSFDFLKQYKSLVDQYKSALQIFLDVYDVRRQEAISNLGTLANPNEYPDVSAIEGEFSVELTMNPVPDTTDFSRLSLPAELTEVLADRLAKQYTISTESAMDDLRERVIEQVGRFANITGKLSKGETTRVRESLIDNLQNTVSLLRSSNITSNEKLDDLADRLQTELLSHDTTTIKKSKEITAEIHTNAKKVLVDMELEDVYF